MFTAFTMVAIAEMGDKTQFLVMALTSCYRKRDIFAGITISIILLNIIAVALGTVINKYVPLDLVKLIAGAMFLFFAFTALKKECVDDVCETKDKTKFPAFLTIACTFFLTELGDKTQLTILNLSAATEADDNVLMMQIMIFIGGTLGLILADSLGIIVGIFLGKKLPQTAFQVMSAVIFAVFGIVTLYTPFKIYLKEFAVLGIVLLSIITVFLCVFIYYRSRKENMKL